MKIHYLPLTILGLIAVVNHTASAQEQNLKKEVKVVKPYEPSISDAFKINIQPKIEDTVMVNPNFSYRIIQRPINTFFAPSPITAARMLPEPLSKLKQALVRVSVGNHSLPTFEAYYNNRRNPNYLYGGWFTLTNTVGRVPLANGKKNKADGYNHELLLFGKRMFRDKILQGDLSFNKKKVTYYGYNTANTALTYTPEAQKTSRFNANIRFNTTHKDSANINYSVTCRFEHLADAFDFQENRINGAISGNRFLKNEQIGASVTYTTYLRNNTFTLDRNSIFTFNPWIHFFGKRWRITTGVSIVNDANNITNNSYFFPNAHFSYDIVSRYVIPYIEFKGHVQENSYSALLGQNPWLLQGTSATNTIHKLVIESGIKGKFSPAVTYHVSASYSIIDSMLFFTNTSISATNNLLNRFDAIFDNAEVTGVSGELTILPSSRFTVNLQARYYTYKLKTLTHPWHRPSYTAHIKLRYSVMDMLTATVRLFSVGERHVQEAGNVIKLDRFTDISCAIEYCYNKRSYLFVNLNNLTNKNYQEWFLYPVFGFNMQVGAAYKF